MAICKRFSGWIWSICCVALAAAPSYARSPPLYPPINLLGAGDSGYADDSTSWKDRAIASLPPAIGDNLDVTLWGWAGDLQTNGYDAQQNYYDLELGLGITKSFDQRVTFSAQGNFIDANNTRRVELEQAYTSIKLLESTSTILTAGKMNANFGAEGRDFWDRKTGTTSLLFSAQPQDLLGIMLTQPIGRTRIIVRPFISADFQGNYNFDQSPSAGVVVEYRPSRVIDLKVTNWVGPGFATFGGRPLRRPFLAGSYGDAAAAIENWQGPNLMGTSASTLYFLEGAAIIHPNPDLTLAAEGLLGTTSTHNGRFGWWGLMAMADEQLTDELHAFVMWSYLDDKDWLITGTFQTTQEVSFGLGYDIMKDVELRGEYRRDFSNAVNGFDAFSIHVTFTY